VFSKARLVGERNSLQKNLKAASLSKEIDASLKRLEVDTIDLYQIHWPTEDIEEGWRTFADAQTTGKVRWIGVSNFDVPQMKAIQKIAPINSDQPPYSLLNREAEKEVLPFCLANHIGVIVFSPMASGLLSGAMTRERFANFRPTTGAGARAPGFRNRPSRGTSGLLTC